MSPSEVVRQAVRLGLSVISISDHDTISGIGEARQEAAKHDIRILNGVEITTSFQHLECHLLAYDFNPEHRQLVELLRVHQNARVERARWIIKQLNAEGLELDIDEVMAEAYKSPVGRPHIAKILCQKGYVATAREAFIRYLSDNALGAIPSNYFDYAETINIVHAAGGVVMVAHPGRLYDKDKINQLIDAGIDGLEVFHPSHNSKMQRAMEKIAAEHHLLISGGSDFHGSDASANINFGSTTISVEAVAAIQTHNRRGKRISA